MLPVAVHGGRASQAPTTTPDCWELCLHRTNITKGKGCSGHDRVLVATSLIRDRDHSAHKLNDAGSTVKNGKRERGNVEIRAPEIVCGDTAKLSDANCAAVRAEVLVKVSAADGRHKLQLR